MPSLIRSLVIVALAALLLPGLSHAQVPDPYEAEVPVASQSEADRQVALPLALEQVLRKLGERNAGGIARDTDARALLRQYRYRQEAAGGADGLRVQLHLIARFDPQGVNRLLGDAVASPVAPRPVQAVLWLAIDDGSGARMVSQAAAVAVQTLTARAVQRGISLRLPLYDAQDQAILQTRDLTTNENWAVDTATRRYGTIALVGWMRRGGDGWLADWRVRDGEVELARWTSRDTQASAVLAAGGDGLADAVQQRLARPVFSGPAGHYRVVVEGLTDAADYARVMSLLSGQPIVRSVSVLQLDQSRLELELDLSAGVEDLVRLLRGGALESIFVGNLQAPSEFVLGRH